MGRILRVSQGAPEASVLAEAAAVLSRGGVVVMPTDSVYGIGCAATPDNPGHQRIFGIKRRERAQALPWLVADPDDLATYAADLPLDAVALAAAFWPGALTLVVRASDSVPAQYRGADGSIALRMPDSNLVRALARRVGSPLATTSANTHGKAAATSASGVEARIVEEADLTLDAGPAPIAIASTIVSVIGARPKVLREGAIATDEVMRALV